MKVSVQVIMHPDDDTEASPVVREVFTLDRDDLAPDTLGLELAEAKDLLAAVQDTVAGQQATTAITEQVACPDCGRARRHKDTRTIVVRSLSGVLRLASPRWWHCTCRCCLNAQAEHLLDWFHLTMRITVMTNMAKSLPLPAPDPEYPDRPPAGLAGEVSAQLGRLKWFCWHGNVFRALLGRGHERKAGEVVGVVAERGLGVGEEDVVPAAVLAALDDGRGAVALFVVPEVAQIAADAEAAAARLVAVAVDVPDDDARGLDGGGDGRDVGMVRRVVGHPGGLVQPLGLVDQVPVDAAGERDRHRGDDLGGLGVGCPPVAVELAVGLLDEGVPVVPRDGGPPRERAAAAPGGLGVTIRQRFSSRVAVAVARRGPTSLRAATE